MPSRLASATIFVSSAGIEALALLPAHRRLDRDHRHARDDARAFGLIEHVLDVVGGERRAARRQRHQRQVAQRLRAVAFVLIEVALLLHDHAARPAGQRPHRHVVGERAGRHEDRPLLAEHARALRFQLLDDAAERVGVGDDLLVEQADQQRGVLRRRQPDTVAAQADGAIVWRRGRRGQRRGRQRDGRGAQTTSCRNRRR